MRNVLRFALFAATTLFWAPSAWATFTGPTSPYYLDQYRGQEIYVVQGTKVINSFPWAYGPCSADCEGMLAVTNRVSTDGFGDNGNPAGQYRLNGTATGTSWPGLSLRLIDRQLWRSDIRSIQQLTLAERLAHGLDYQTTH
jgi:hypothetical protein